MKLFIFCSILCDQNWYIELFALILCYIHFQDKIWPADLPEGDLQIDRLYSFYCGCPPQVFPTLFRHITKVTHVLLLWKQGIMGRQGAVEFLLEQLQDWQGKLVHFLYRETYETASLSQKLYMWS